MHIVLFHFYSSKPNPVYQEISAALRRRGHTVWVGQPDENEDLIWLDENRIVETLPGPKTKPEGWLGRLPLPASLRTHIYNFAFIRRLRRYLHELKPDVVQANMHQFAWVLPLFNPGQTSYFLDIRQINESVDKNFKALVREVHQVLDMRINARFCYPYTFFCHESAAIKILGKNWKRRASIIPVGLDDSFLTMEPVARQNNTDDPVRFVYIGRLSRFRSLQVMLLAAQRILKTTDQFSIDLVGLDDSGGYYQNMVQELGISSVVHLKPPIDYSEIPAMILRHDVGLAYVPDRPTWHYQPAIKALEFRALGIPMISTDVTAHRELVNANVNGLLAQDNAESFAECMEKFILDRAFLESCRDNARTMRSGKTWGDVAQLYEKDYLTFRSAENKPLLKELSQKNSK